MTQAKMAAKMLPVLNDDMLFFVDDVVYCGAHSGMSARFSGRTINGNPVVSVQEDCDFHGDDGIFKCETCGKRDGESR